MPGLVKSFREAIRHYGWDQPIRPEHIPVPAIPRLGVLKEVRAVLIFTLVFMALSSIGTIPLRGLFPNPIMGFPSVLDAIAYLTGPYFALGRISFTTHVQQTPTLPTWALSYAIALIVCAAPAAIAALAFYARPDKLPKRYEGAGESSEWATMNDMAKSGLLDHGKPGIVVGAVQPPPFPAPFTWIKRPLELLIDANPSHVVMDAASRSGKDVGPVTFTGATYPYSLCFNDAKSEQYAIQSGIQRDFYDKYVYRLAFQAPEIGALETLPNGTTREEKWGCTKHNLLEDIPWGTDREFSAVLQSSSLITCKDLKMLDDPDAGHWFRTSRVAHTALCYKVTYDPLETMRNVSRTAMLLAGDDAMDEEARAAKAALATDGAEVDSIHSVIEHYLGFSASGRGSTPAWLKRAVTAKREECKQRLALRRMKIGIEVSESQYAREEQEERGKTEREIAKLEAALVHPDLERAVRLTMRIRGEEAGSVYSTLNANLTPWLDPRVMANTRTSEMRLTDWLNADRPCAIFLNNSQDYGDMYTPIYRTTVDLMIRLHLPEMAFDEEKTQVVSPNRWPGIFIANEPMTMGDIPSLMKNLPFLASYKMRFFFPFQLRSQRIELYGENEPITGNCFTHISHTPSDDKDRESLSKGLGKRLVVGEDHSSQGGLASINRSHQLREVDIMTPSDIMRMPNDMIPVSARDDKGEIVPVPNADGSLTVAEQAFQIVRMRRGHAYVRKIQWYTNEFLSVFRLVKRFRPVPPNRRIVTKQDAAAAFAETQASVTPPENKPTRHEPTITLTPLKTGGRSGVQTTAVAVDETAQPIATTKDDLPPSFRDILE